MPEDIIENLKKMLKSNPDGVTIKVKVTANAKKNSIEFFKDGIVKIKINKPAVENKANMAIIEYLSDILSLPKSNIIILKGVKSSLKDLRIIPKSHII